MGHKGRLTALALALLLAACTQADSRGGGSVLPTATGGAAHEPAVAGSVIESQIEARWDTSEKLRGRLHVMVDAGRVLLTGVVGTQDEKAEAVRLAWQADGVRTVLNEIEIGEDGFSDRATDNWITAQFRSKLMFDPDISSKNISIDSVNQTLYLFGKARSQQEMDRILQYARDLARVKRVVNHVRF